MVRFEYEPRNSFLHNRNPLAAGIAMLYLATLGAIYWDLRFLAVVVAIGVLLSWNSKVPTGWYKGLSVTWFGKGVALITDMAAITMVRAEFFKVLPPEFTGQVITELTPEGFPILGRTAITYGVLYWYVAGLIQFGVLMIAGCMTVYTINPSDVVLFLKRMKMPTVIVLMIQAGLRYFSTASQTLTNVWNAQTLRGMRIKTRNPIKLSRYISPFLIPLGRQFVWTVDQVSISTCSRAYGSSMEFHPYKELKRDWIDSLIIFGLPLLLVIQIYFLVTPPYYFGLI